MLTIQIAPIPSIWTKISGPSLHVMVPRFLNPLHRVNVSLPLYRVNISLPLRGSGAFAKHLFPVVFELRDGVANIYDRIVFARFGLFIHTFVAVPQPR